MSEEIAFGETKVGKLDTDHDQLKVHRRMLSRLHLGLLKNALRQTLNNLPNQEIQYSQYVLDKFKNQEISCEKEMIQETVNLFLSNTDNGSDVLIEYNEKVLNGTKLDRRILLRSKTNKVVKLKNENIATHCNYCFSINIDNACIITVYWNKVNDVHERLDYTIYQQPSKAQGLTMKS